MAVPQALTEAGLLCEYQDGGSRLVVREAEGPQCPIRKCGSEALARLLKKERAITSLDISRSNISDNGVGELCLALRQTDQLEELRLSTVGHAGLEFLLGVVRRCDRLRELHVTVVDVANVQGLRQTLEAGDYDTSAFSGVKRDGDEEEEEEAEEEELLEDGDEEPEERERRKTEKLRQIFAANDYDSEEEKETVQQPEAGENAASPAVLRLLTELLQVARKRENLTVLEVAGDLMPPGQRLDLAKAMQEHCKLRERKISSQEPVVEAVRSQLQALDEAIATDPAAFGAPQGPSFGVPGGPGQLGVRSFLGQKLVNALGEALFECQRHKAKENEALSTPQGEVAFLAMYLKENAAKFRAAA